jgi:hypothetical protein
MRNDNRPRDQHLGVCSAVQPIQDRQLPKAVHGVKSAAGIEPFNRGRFAGHLAEHV